MHLKELQEGPAESEGSPSIKKNDNTNTNNNDGKHNDSNHKNDSNNNDEDHCDGLGSTVGPPLFATSHL